MAALPFQAHANYGTWSIDFGDMYWWLISSIIYNFQKLHISFPERHLSLTPSPFAKRLLELQRCGNWICRQNFGSTKFSLNFKERDFTNKMQYKKVDWVFIVKKYLI